MNQPSDFHELQRADEPALIADQASALLDRRRIPQARALLGPALQQHPDNVALLFESARADYLEDRNAQARETLGHLMQRAPGDVSARWLLFLAERDDGRLAEAEALILPLLRENPQHAPFYAGYSILMLRALDIQKARELALEGLRCHPDDEGCLQARALCDMVEGRGDHEALARLVARDPSNVYTLRLVVVAMAQRGQLSAAHRLAQELLRMQPDDRQLLNQVNELRVNNHWSLLPLWPMRRWGWGASVAIWLGAVGLMQGLRNTVPAAVPWVAGFFLVYVVYSWVWPPLLRRWFKVD